MEINLRKTDANEKEILEMVLQFFYENKYIESAKMLESKANIIYDQNEVQQLKYLLKNHQFHDSVKFLESSNFENIQKTEVLKILKTRKFLELVMSGNRRDALEYLRTDIAPLQMDTKTLNKYSVILFGNQEDLIEKHLKPNFNEIYNDELLINKVQSLLCLSIDSNGNRILPNSRLETLLNTYNNYHNPICVDRLYSSCDFYEENTIHSFKNFKYFTIEKHEDEVWHLELSNNKKYLATCSRNGMMAVFSIDIEESFVKIECVSYFLAHKKNITCIKWSKNDMHIISSSADKSIKLWNPYSGKCLKTFAALHSDIVTSVTWLNEEMFVSGGIDKKMVICTINSREICSEYFSRIRKVLVSEALKCLIIIPASMNDIILFDFINNKEINRLTELDPIISSSLSTKDMGMYLLSNTSKVNANINLYDLSNFTLINKYYGHTQEQFSIECSFAGTNDEFILCGSEDASIYIWHRNNSIPLSIIKGHTGTVNSCVLSFYKEMPLMFSVSDDFTIRVWTCSNTEILYEDHTATKSKRKISDIYRDDKFDVTNNSNQDMPEFSMLIDNEHVQGSNLSESDDDENESEMSN